MEKENMTEMQNKDNNQVADIKNNKSQNKPNHKGNSRRKRNRSNSRNRTNSGNNRPQTQMRPTNNANMYFTNTELASQAAQFSFSNFLGQSQLSDVFGVKELPTVMSIAINPSPGFSNGDLTNGINITGLRTYTRLSAGNAKTTNYAPQDVSTLILAVGEVISMIEVAKRAMRVAYTYNQRNRALPLGIISAMGINPSFVTNGTIAAMRLKLNYAINSFNQVPILANVTYFEKCAEVYANYYTDSQGNMTQYYVFSPYSTWVLNETAIDRGSVLETVNVCLGSGESKQMEMSSLIDIIMRMINALLQSSTFNYIYSDILRLCGPEDLLTVPLLSEAEVILPIYDPMKLLQIHNSVSMGVPSYAATYEKGKVTPRNDVYPNVDTNGLEYCPIFSAGYDSFVVDFPHSDGNPDLDQKVDATRYVGYQQRIADGESTVIDFENSTIPDHYVVEYEFFYNSIFKTAFFSFMDMDMTDRDKLSNVLYVSSMLEKFDYHPMVLIKNNVTGISYSYEDLDFFTVIDAKYLQRFNDLAFQGLFEFRTSKF